MFDTVSVCFSKGMGTPLGTVLTGKNTLMQKAMRVRKVLGGGMRQTGFMAAAAIYALDHNRERLNEDHRKATELEHFLAAQNWVKKVEPVETNIIIFEVFDEKAVSDYCSKHDIIISNMGHGKLRLVTHLDYTDAMHTEFMEVMGKFKG